ncbi:MAG: class I SAM-dependent methyltransferase [Sideroxydans sp.]|nr:class I SAM-dependent methyltransferase [Sideroxydans sp.]
MLPAQPPAQAFENVTCYQCGSSATRALLQGQDDLTGKPGHFQFVTCEQCGLSFQQPRLTLENIKPYYDDEYIAHRKKTDWGWLTPFYLKAMRRHDLAKLALVDRYVALHAQSKVLDIGCGAATFLQELVARDRVQACGVDFKNLAHLPGFDQIDFRCGLLAEQQFAGQRFDLITMWHFLEHDYDPINTLQRCRDLLSDDGRLVIEVPRLDSLSYRLYHERWPGLQAPQHTLLFSRDSLLNMVRSQGLKVVEYLPYGAFPPYFYLFTGLAFKLLKGRGLNLDRAILPYFLGQLLCAPVLLFQRQLNLAMQTVVCQRA